MVSAVNSFTPARAACSKLSNTQANVPSQETQKNIRPIILLPLIRNWSIFAAHNRKAKENNVRKVEEISRSHPP